MCVCVCVLSVRDHVFGPARPIFTNFLHVTYGRGSVLLWRRSDTLRISGFIYDVMFAHKLIKAARRRRQAEAVTLTRTQPWAWRVRIPVAGSGRSGLLLGSQGLLCRSGRVDYL